MKPNVPLPPRAAIEKLAGDALREDIGGGDLTAALIEPQARARAKLFCRERAVLCGAAWFEQAFHQVDREIEIAWHCEDGAHLRGGELVCEVRGRAREMLTAERTAINLLQTLSGTATTARRYAEAAAGGARIMDTRKTIPGLRLAQKYAAAIGGAHNHRIGLFDQVLIKENHIAAAGSLENAVRRARAVAPGGFVEVEVETLAQLQQALAAGAARILLDNFDLEKLREAVTLARGRAELEASGNVSLDDVRAIAATGVDCISIGALTKHLAAVDFSLRFDGA
ncbi:MAG: carboxylating nicotinate-nucleotide diphosphorylase [Gammaproteobacteria bacterium]